MADKFIGYRCSICGKEYEPQKIRYVCPLDGGNLDVILDYSNIRQRYDMEDITCRADNSLWRYLPLLPVNDPDFTETTFRAVGWTPLYRPELLRQETGLKHLWVKDEGRNPTASLKDRASAVVLARALEINADIVVTASTGNAGAALAGLSAAIGHKAIIFAPKNAPPAKVTQLLIYGAQVILVDGNYDQAFDLSVQASREFGWYCRNTGYNPFTVEGKKTAAFEIWESILVEFNHHMHPFSVFVSVGDGNIISGMHKGFKDLHALGWIERLPRIFGVQAVGSAAIANAFYANTEEIVPVQADTIADSISVDLPRDGVRAVRAARETGGSFLVVEDEDILSAIASLGRAGVFAEPAAAASYAGLLKAVKEGLILPDDPVVVVITGNGLKDIRAAMKAVAEAPVIEPSMQALKAYLQT